MKTEWVSRIPLWKVIRTPNFCLFVCFRVTGKLWGMLLLSMFLHVSESTLNFVVLQPHIDQSLEEASQMCSEHKSTWGCYVNFFTTKQVQWGTALLSASEYLLLSGSKPFPDSLCSWTGNDHSLTLTVVITAMSTGKRSSFVSRLNKDWKYLYFINAALFQNWQSI